MAAIAVLAFLYVLAAPAAPHNSRVLALDTDGDGYLSHAETHGIPGYALEFYRADADHDGQLDPREFLRAESLYDVAAVKDYVGDSLITAKVKTGLLKVAGADALHVGVVTVHRRVLLSGRVDDDAQRQSAVQIASAADGVLDVMDGLLVR
ncbi:MAG: BON domain-containing protein [Burkholderiales bacterium]